MKSEKKNYYFLLKLFYRFIKKMCRVATMFVLLMFIHFIPFGGLIENKTELEINDMQKLQLEEEESKILESIRKVIKNSGFGNVAIWEKKVGKLLKTFEVKVLRIMRPKCQQEAIVKTGNLHSLPVIIFWIMIIPNIID